MHAWWQTSLCHRWDKSSHTPLASCFRKPWDVNLASIRLWSPLRKHNIPTQKDGKKQVVLVLGKCLLLPSPYQNPSMKLLSIEMLPSWWDLSMAHYTMKTPSQPAFNSCTSQRNLGTLWVFWVWASLLSLGSSFGPPILPAHWSHAPSRESPSIQTCIFPPWKIATVPSCCT